MDFDPRGENVNETGTECHAAHVCEHILSAAGVLRCEYMTRDIEILDVIPWPNIHYLGTVGDSQHNGFRHEIALYHYSVLCLFAYSVGHVQYGENRSLVTKRVPILQNYHAERSTQEKSERFT